MTSAQAFRQRLRAGGLYLVVDPKPGAEVVLPRVEAALEGGASVLQIWNHWADGQNREAFIAAAMDLARGRGVPVLVHEEVELLRATGADGIHYDEPALTPAEVRGRIGRDKVLYGVTCGNDPERVRKAAEERADYVSFCAMFPSPSAGSCEIVELQTLRTARALRDEEAGSGRDFAIFASGGITPGNARAVLEAGADGIAVISGILSADDPKAAARAYAQVLEAGRERETPQTRARRPTE